MKARYTYRFYPTDEQKQQLAQTFGCVRYVYNWALDMKRKAYLNKSKQISSNEISRRLTQLRKEDETNFLTEVSRVPLTHSLRDLDKAYTQFVKGNNKQPNFRTRKGRQSATYVLSSRTFYIKNHFVKLAKQKEPLNIVWSRPLPSEPTSLTVIQEPDGRYFVSFVVEIDPKPLEKTNQTVGIDLGLKDVVVTSDGWKSGNPKYLARSQKKLKREQRKLAKKQKGSANYEKQRCKLARLHRRVTDQRKDFLHKLSTDLVQKYDVICVETLAMKNMVKNHKLAEAISDAGWGAFVEMLRYKCEWYGKELVKIDKWYPSTKTCSNCWAVTDTIPLNVRYWTCSDCGVTHDRGVNAAKIVKAVGMAVAACGEDVRPASVSLDTEGQTSLKQEVCDFFANAFNGEI